MTGQCRLEAGSSSRFRACVGCLGAASPLPAIHSNGCGAGEAVGMGGPPEVPHRPAEGSIGELGTAESTTYGMLLPALACFGLPSPTLLGRLCCNHGGQGAGHLSRRSRSSMPDMFRGVRHFALFLKRRPRGCLAASRSGCRSRRVWLSEQAIAGMHYSLNRCSWGLQWHPGLQQHLSASAVPGARPIKQSISNLDRLRCSPHWTQSVEIAD